MKIKEQRMAMIPSRLSRVESMPLNRNGKTDRERLRLLAVRENGFRNGLHGKRGTVRGKTLCQVHKICSLSEEFGDIFFFEFVRGIGGGFVESRVCDEPVA